MIDAMRSFRIPAWMQEAYGYPALTPAVIQRILGGNATALYGLDPSAIPVRHAAEHLAWLDSVRAELARRSRD